MSDFTKRYGFKTAYLQKEFVEDVVVCSSESGAKFKVGQLVAITAANGSTAPAYITKSSTPSIGLAIIAQSDETMEYGHVPVEYGNYKHTDEVAVTKAEASAASSADFAFVKKVAFYKVTDLQDLVAMD